MLILFGAIRSQADDGDWQQWTDLSWTQNLGSGMDLGLRWHGRLEDDFSEFAYTEVEPMLNWRHSPRWDFAISYERDQRIEPMDEAMDVAAVAATVKLPKQPWRIIPTLNWMLSNRFRFDFAVPEMEDADWQPIFRNLTQWQAKWKWGAREWVPYLAEEWFVNLDRGELVQNRLSVGVGLPIVPHWMARLYWMRLDEKINDTWEWHPVVGASIETSF